MTTAPPAAAPVKVEQIDRDAAANAVLAYRGRKNNDWQQRIRDGKCDDGEMVQALARHRLAAIAFPGGEPIISRAEVERLTAALRTPVDAVRSPDDIGIREALEWYSRTVADCRKITRDGDDARAALDKDGGKRAAAALAREDRP